MVGNRAVILSKSETSRAIEMRSVPEITEILRFAQNDTHVKWLVVLLQKRSDESAFLGQKRFRAEEKCIEPSVTGGEPSGGGSRCSRWHVFVLCFARSSRTEMFLRSESCRMLQSASGASTWPRLRTNSIRLASRRADLRFMRPVLRHDDAFNHRMKFAIHSALLRLSLCR